MIHWRDAESRDAADLADVGARTFTETFGHLYHPDDLNAFLKVHTVENWAREIEDPAYAIRVGHDDGQVAGYAKLGPPKLPFTPKQGAIELRQFYLLKPWHGTGDATVLMAWALETARARGATSVYLSVFVDNHRARRFYERHGFRRIGSYAFMVGNHADEDDVMVLEF